MLKVVAAVTGNSYLTTTKSVFNLGMTPLVGPSLRLDLFGNASSTDVIASVQFPVASPVGGLCPSTCLSIQALGWVPPPVPLNVPDSPQALHD